MVAGCGGPQPSMAAPNTVVHVDRDDRHIADVPAYKFSGPLVFVASSDPEGPVTIYQARENNPKPIATISKGFFDPAGVCVDGDGTLYTVESGNGTIREYALGTTKPFQIITQGLLSPAFCAIDPSGNLWVTNMGGRDLVEYKKGKTNPHKVIKDGLANPDGIAIDHAGNIYVGNLEPPSSSNVQIYPPDGRKPLRTITDGVRWPVGIALDAKDTLLGKDRERKRIADSKPSGVGAPDSVDFQRDILPKLQTLPVRVIAEAMGASLSHGSKVRGGKLVPHRRHWKVLLQLR